MESSAMIVALVDKLGHRLPDIRDRAMKAITRKLLSPVSSGVSISSLSRCTGVAHLILQWFNDRYDCVPLDMLCECVEGLTLTLVKSPELRDMFVDAGAISFFQDFMQHNPAIEKGVRVLVSCLLQDRPEMASPASTLIAGRNPLQVTSPSREFERYESIPGLSAEDEQTLFDLAVRVKFATSSTPQNGIESIGREIRFGFCVNLPALVYVARPSLLEALCCQLGCNGPSLSPIKEIEPLLVALLAILERIHAANLVLDEEMVSSLLVACVDALDKRAGCAPIISSLVSFFGGRVKLSATYSNRVICSLGRVTKNIFREDSYRIERLTFADNSAVSVRRMIEWTPFNRVAASIVIQILSVCASAESAPLFLASPPCVSLLAHVSDWISDDVFYDSKGNAKSLASSAAVSLATLDPETQCEFARARELALCLRKDKAGTALSDRELQDLFVLWTKVPELVFSSDPVVLVKKFLNQSDSFSGLAQVVSQDERMGDALCTLLPQGKRFLSEKLAGELIAFIRCSNFSSFASALLSGTDWLPLWNPSEKYVSDVSLPALARSLFSRSEAVRKQAASLIDPSFRSTDPLSRMGNKEEDMQSDSLNQYVLGRMTVEKQEVLHAVSIVANARLGVDIRTASCVQACTLVASSGEFLKSCDFSEQELVGPIEKVLQESQDPPLLLAVCHLLWWLLKKGLVVHVGLETVLKKVFHSNIEVANAAMLVLVRLAFDRTAVLGQGLSEYPRLFIPLLKRLEQTAFHLPCLIEDQIGVDHFIDSISVAPSNKAVAICVSLCSIPPNPCISQEKVTETEVELFAVAGKLNLDSNAMQRLLVAMETGPVSLGKFAQETLWKSIRIAKCMHDEQTSVNLSLGILKNFTKSATLELPPWFLCEYLDAVLSALKLTKDLSVLPHVESLMEISNIEVWRCILKIMVFSVSLKPARILPLVPRTISSAAYRDDFCFQAIIYILIEIRDLETGGLDLQPLLKLVNVASSENKQPLRVALEWRFLRVMHSQKRLMASECISIFQTALSLVFEPPVARLVLSEAFQLAAAIIRDSSSEEQQAVTNPIVDALAADILFDKSTLENIKTLVPLIEAVAEKRGKEVSHILIQNDRWSYLLSSPCVDVVLGLAAVCMDADPRLVGYLAQQGLFEAMAESLLHACNMSLAVVWILEKVRLAIETGPANLHRFESCISWLQSDRFASLVSDLSLSSSSDDREGLFCLVSVSSEIIVMSGVVCVSQTFSSAFVAFLGIVPSPVLSVKGCAALTQLVRVPGPSWPSHPEIIDMMRVHESVCVPDNAAKESSLLYFSQMRLAAAFGAAACTLDADIAQTYSDWFCDLWRKSCLIPVSKQTSPVPMISELVCGFLEVVAVADLSLPCWGPPLSHVLSFLTRSDLFHHMNLPVKVFALCLSVAEAASAVLVRKAVTARVLSNLISQHAVIHGKHVPKDVKLLARAGAVIHLAASLVGCRLCASEILKSLDGWLEARHVLDQEVLVRLVSSVVLAAGYCRGAIAANQDAIALLKSNDENRIAKESLTLLNNSG